MQLNMVWQLTHAFWLADYEKNRKNIRKFDFQGQNFEKNWFLKSFSILFW